ncbi:MAG TPA: hemerythrin domain-containing protein [Burkholderiales bacterium]|jgi:iron-sulfur cluster repair protein YtfE (RIC family)|nr:hemerythrin domain-containing protein [Burkholderiales bacterium]
MPSKQSSAETRDAIDFLMDDHKRVQKIFKDFESVDRDEPEAVQELVETACIELQIHSMLEEEIFYPAVRGRVDEGDRKNQDLLNMAEVEHESVDELIARLQELEPDDAMYAAHFMVLAEYVKHHIAEEEEQLFPEVKKMALDLPQLGEDMLTRREELFAEMEADDDEGAESEDEGALEASADDSELSDLEEEDEDEQEQVEISRTRH